MLSLILRFRDLTTKKRRWGSKIEKQEKRFFDPTFHPLKNKLSLLIVVVR